ncbi:TIGR02678 family protein [Bacillus mangrovi]|uniref:TIGR02678 family protein n=1 Tax=Metabacillus mangrovi TaxID=1491830 RepID=A0A7X2V5K0_9BACI|nr:TIGR02678 family protein [Metabacillus mangrovi]MTH54254.1 TIGR02678 family protein [Metabacillus mangrovi]
METVLPFDEKTEDALGILFEQFWVLRSDDPAAYHLIREREHSLKRYLSEKFGFDLIIHQHFIKLEKIPVDPKSWMGIQEFTEPMDYAVFCCALAFSERRSVDEQFLLSDLTEDVQEMYPGEFPLDWTNFQHRKSLVRALKKLMELKLIKAVDGEIDLFAASEEEEVLYEVTVYARYFMRSYPEDLFRYETIEEILVSEWSRQQDERRKRVYRKLMFSPIVYRESEDDPDFAYIRNFRNRLRDDLEEHTPFRLEVYKNAALLIMPERKQRYTLYPDQRGISDISLQIAAWIRLEKERFQADERGEIRITYSEAEQLIADVKGENGHGWSKQYRESSAAQVTEEWLQLLGDWELAYMEPETDLIVLQSGLGRMIGVYPKDYVKEEGSA